MLRLFIFLSLFLVSFAEAQTFPPLRVEEVDGSPTSVATKLIFSNGTVTRNGTEFTVVNSGGGGGDSVSIDSSAVVDPDFVSTGDIDFVDTSNTITANINANTVSADELNATGVEAELEAVLDLQELQGAVTDAQVPDNITITETDPNALLTAGTDNVKDTHIDFGEGATQVSARDIPMAVISGSTYSTLQDLQNIFHSSGYVSGGAITDAGAATINVASGIGLIRATDSAVAEILYFDWSASSGLAITADSIRYVGIEYNAGTPQVTVRTTDNFNNQTDFALGVVVNEGGVLHIAALPHYVGDHATNMITRSHETLGIKRDNITGGITLGETGTRNITLSTGFLWDKLNKYTISAVDTSVADTFDTYSAGGLEATGATTWPNTQYDNAGTLTTMTNNRYAVLWFYTTLDDDLLMVYGTNEYTSVAGAEEEGFPATLPNRIQAMGILVARLIFKKSDATATSIISAFTSGIAGSSSSDHGNLSGLADDDHPQYLQTVDISDDTNLAGDSEIVLTGDALSIASTIARDSELHSAATVSDSSEIDLTLSGQDISGVLIAGSIDETKLDASTNASLDLADSALQAEVDGSTTNEIQNLFETFATTSGTSPVADSATDTLTLTAGSGITVTGDSSTDTVTIASTVTDTDTNANTICSGTTTYLDGEGNCDDISSVYEPAGITESDISDLSHTVDTTLSEEQVEDFIGAGMIGNTETRIAVTYQDADGTFDFVVDDMNDDVPESGDFGNADDLESTGELSADVVDATKIADNAIQEEHLKAVNAPTDEYVLTYESTTGDFEWQASAGSLSLSDLSNVAAMTEAQGDLLYYSTMGEWDRIAAGSDGQALTMSTGNPVWATIDHDALTNFVANEHIDWTSTSENFNTTGTLDAGHTTISPTGTTDTGFLVTSNTLTTGYLSNFYSNGSDTSNRRIMSLINDNTAATGTILLYGRQDSTADIVNLFDGVNEVFTILDGGNVGIGVAAPNEALTVEGALSLDEISAPSTTAGYGKIYVNSTDSELHYYGDSDDDCLVTYDITTTEVKTCEKLNGSHLYIKLLELGAMPNNTENSDAHGITSPTFYSMTGAMHIGTNAYTLPYVHESTSFMRIRCDSTYCYQDTNGNFSSATGYLILRYTK